MIKTVSEHSSSTLDIMIVVHISILNIYLIYHDMCFQFHCKIPPNGLKLSIRQPNKSYESLLSNHTKIM